MVIANEISYIWEQGFYSNKLRNSQQKLPNVNTAAAVREDPSCWKCQGYNVTLFKVENSQRKLAFGQYCSTPISVKLSPSLPADPGLSYFPTTPPQSENNLL